MRIAICGVPRAGKTTFAMHAHEELGIELQHTDDLARPDHRWSREAEATGVWLSEPGPWIVEGVTVALALESSPEPDVAIWLGTPRQLLTPGQERLAANCRQAWERLRLGCLVLLGSEEAYTWLADQE